MKILVCGGRYFGEAPSDSLKFNNILDRVHSAHGITLLIHGGATGADWFAACWAEWREIDCLRVPARWKTVGGKSAGPIRNTHMLDMYKPDLVVAFPGSNGTDDCVRKATARGIPVYDYRENF